jgi:WD40 repeat protein
MSKPDDRLHALLQAPAAAAWQARLTAAFFDADAQRQAVEELRAWIAQNADLPPARRETLLADVLRHFLATASRHAVAPAADVPSTGAELEDHVITAYPYPIATPYRALTEQESATAAFGCLLDTFESLVHFLATVAVSAYLRGPARPDCDRQLLERLAKEGWSVGDLWALLRDTVRSAVEGLPYAELPGYLFTSAGAPTASARVLESFVTLRNRVWGHGTGRDEAFFAGLLPANRARLDAELARCGWLASWDLVRPVTIEEGHVTRADLLRGERRLKGRPFSLPLQPADLDPETSDVHAERSLLLVSGDRQRYLPLFPLALFHFQLRCQGVYFLQRPQWKREAGRRRLRKAGYVAYESGLETHDEGPGEPAARALERHVGQLEARLGAAALPLPEAAPAADPDCQLPEVRQELEFHRRTFAGRDDVLRRVAAWLEAPEGAGYVVLLGPPGQGKSALLAEVARRAGPTLVHMIKSHRNPLKFLPALVSQAADLAGARFGADAYAGDLDDLRNALVRALEAVRDKHGRSVLVLDALDELDARHERLAFLPEVLPAGVRAVLSCRPDIPLVQALRARLRRLEEWPLRPLSHDDLWPVLRRRLQAELSAEADVEPLLERVTALVDWPALFDRLQGNPLFLQRALDQAVHAARAGSAVRPDAFPATLEALFGAIYNEIAEKDGTVYRRPEGRLKARLLHFFCLAREPLGFEALCGLLAADGTPLSLEECRDRVWEMSPYLLEPAGQRFKPWHQGLADFVRSHVLGKEGCRQTEAVFAAWLRQPGAGLYALRHQVRHLLGAGLAEEAAGLLLGRAFVEARAEEEPVFDLVNDQSDVLEALPAGHVHAWPLRLLEEALRTDLHFIARHPEALFQCLYNRGVWYDSPEAGRHYLPTVGTVPPWERTRPKLSELLERWRAERPPRPWLRALRPPEIHLGTAQRMVFRGHEAGVTSVAVAPAGNRVVSASEDCSVRVWELPGGEEVLCLRGHDRRVQGVALTPDGRHVVSASDDRTVRLWDASDGRELLCLVGHRGPVGCVACSPDGRLLASGGDDRSVRLWDATTGRHLACLRGHRRWVGGVAFSTDSRHVASASGDGTVRLWDVEARREVACLSGHTGPVNAVALAAGLLASGSQDETVRLWDLAFGREVACLRGHRHGVRCVAFAADGRWLVTGGDDRQVRVWDVRARAERACLEGHEVAVRGVAGLADGRIVSASADATVRLWDPAGGGALLQRRGHTSWVTCVAFSPDGRWVASGSGDRTVRLATLDGEQQLVLTGHEDRVWAVAFALDSRRLASGSRDRTVRIWDLAHGREALSLHGHEGEVRSVAFTPDGLRLVSGGKDQAVRVWEAATGMELRCLRGLGSNVVSVACSPDGTLLAAGTLAGRIAVYDAATGEEVGRLDSAPDDVDALAFSADGRRLVSCSLRWSVRIWEVASGACLETIHGTTDPVAVAAGPGRFPWRAVGRRWHTQIASAQSGEVVARLPGTLHRLTTHPGGRIWAGTHANCVHLFALEGD